MKYDRQEPLSVRASLALVAFAVFLGLLTGVAKAATYGPPYSIAFPFIDGTRPTLAAAVGNAADFAVWKQSTSTKGGQND